VTLLGEKGEASKRVRRVITEGWTVADLELLWAWALVAGGQGRLAREHSGRARWEWLLADQRAQRMATARKWDSDGRPNGAAGTRGHQRASRPNVLSDLINDHHDEVHNGFDR
jgi:hypothetical protein